MKITGLRIKNFRTFQDSGLIPIHSMTVMIGENGSGKTSVIDALSFLLGSGGKPQESDLFNKENTKIEIEAIFTAPNQELERFAVNDSITLKYEYDVASGVGIYSIKTLLYVDDRFNTYESLNANDLKDLLVYIGLLPLRTKEQNLDVIRSYLEGGALEKQEGYKRIKLSDISNFLPILQIYSSSDYKNPESIIGKTLSVAYRSHFYQKDEFGGEVLKPDFSQIRSAIENDLNQKISNDLLGRLKSYIDVDFIGGDFTIDFSKGFSLNSVILKSSDPRLNEKSINNLGDGHNKKIALAIMEWDADVTSGVEGRQIIKAYDEPDANLDFLAQRNIFNVINSGTEQNESVAAVICTHSLALIDRAPAECINQISRVDNSSVVSYLKSNEDADIEEYLKQVAEVGGMRNSNIFYERAFFVVEGESEENILPILYRTYTGRSMADDGIRLINLQTNGQWSNALKFLNANRKDNTVMLLDSDTQSSTCCVTKNKLREIGFGDDFLSNNCFFIGNKEFEDVYPDPYLVRMANQYFPKLSGDSWCESDFQAIRDTEKFSAELKGLISREGGHSIGKPEIALRIGECFTKEDISNRPALCGVFDRIGNIVNR